MSGPPPVLYRILGPERPGARVLLPDKALCLPTFCHSVNRL